MDSIVIIQQPKAPRLKMAPCYEQEYLAEIPQILDTRTCTRTLCGGGAQVLGASTCGGAHCYGAAKSKDPEGCESLN
ncbi:hypothetical protein PSTG_07938 [Puccinia striiformis f. sp. tritici PST-78]|uniref:Uncharacterized protein n=1 Tax=Puccinia striiformis f. sp. tritici PST-78 TaxID=1165861 RepID=A0A0L0VHP3_9BASI|nr:hypothetical protein PSTG_07938 [Puccinia striiformis f. sp. tritici PST-78]